MCGGVAIGIVAVGSVMMRRWLDSMFDPIFPGPVTEAGRYTEVLGSFLAAKPTYVAHFPAAIPSAASGVRMYFQQGVLQGSTMFELRLVLKPADFAAEQSRLQALAARFKPPADFGSYQHTKLWSDGSRDDPASRQSIDLGSGPGLDRWGVTLQPTTGEVAYWAIDD